MRKALKIGGWFTTILVAGAGILFFVAWKSPKYYKVQNLLSESHSCIPFGLYTGEHPRPYIVEAKNAVIFGAAHTRDPKHPEIKMMEEKWETLKPTIALVEGRLGFLVPGLMDPVEELGEGGKVKQLAEREGIPVYNWDLSKEELALHLRARFSNEQIALSQIVQPYFSQLRFGKPSSVEAFLHPFFKRAAFVGMQDSIKEVKDIDRIWKKHFTGLDWRNVSDEGPLPGYLNDMMVVTNDLRNQQLIAVVKELVSKGKRYSLFAGQAMLIAFSQLLNRINNNFAFDCLV